MTEGQVSDIINGKNVVAPIREIQEVKNAIRTYELYPQLNPFKVKDMLEEHGIFVFGSNLEGWHGSRCRKEVSPTSGTVMHGSKLPLLYWFTVIHLLTSTKKTFSASGMQRQLSHKCYQPIWEMMHKLRSVMGKRDFGNRLNADNHFQNYMLMNQ